MEMEGENEKHTYRKELTETLQQKNRGWKARGVDQFDSESENMDESIRF